ncbi:MAG: prepilin-type N-terminal cleavage/methylation domain-containing protein, partial [Xanthomonadales bacterium]|nr:prepilin-type N-terminal cleavage/methylation domain-containing protein [Xanthomonadales bacterium]
MQRRTIAGFTLIELMISMVLGILVSAGIITVFLSTSRSNQVQTQMARLQENGRFAVSQMSDSLRMASASFCSGSGGNASRA